MSDAEGYAATIAAEVADLEAGRLDTAHGTVDQVVGLWLNELALDIVVGTNVRSGEMTSVEVCRTLGGPGAWVTFRRHGPTEVLVIDGRDRAVRLVDRGTVSDLVLEMLEGAGQHIADRMVGRPDEEDSR